jgi:hypothetical protein
MTPVDTVPPVPPRRRWRWVLLALIGMILVSCVSTDLFVGAVRAVGQRVAGVGTLEWAAGGRWSPVDPADARRRIWTTKDAFLAPAWEPVAPGLATAELALRRPPNPLEVRVFLARVDPGTWRFRVWGRPDFAPGAVDELAAQAGLVLAVNASYFSDDGPLGLVVSDGASRGRQGRNRAAHFLVSAGAAGPRIVNEKRAVLGALDQGFQGFPAIMTTGRTYAYMRYGGRGFDVWKVDRRTAACTLRDGEVLLLVTDTLTNGLSLDELATVLGGLGCTDAMGFDGGSSTGLSLRVDGHPRVVANLRPVPVIVGIERR